MSENPRFSDVFRGYWNGKLAHNESSYLADAGKLQQWHDTASIILSRQLHTQNVTIETPEKDVKYVQS